MERIAKEYKKLCPIYNKKTNIKIEFLISESLERSSDDLAPNQILSCTCKEKNNCKLPRHECPVWNNIN